MDPEVKREIEAGVREALGLYGVPGDVHLEGRTIELRGSGPPIAIDIDLLGEQWTLLPGDIRARKCAELARRLHEATQAGINAARGSSKPISPANAPRPVLVVPLGGLVLVLIVVFAIVWVWKEKGVASSDPEPTARPVHSGPEETTPEMQARVCDATRKRIYAGASIGPFDVKGWVIELWLASKTAAPGDAPALRALVSGGKLADAADDELAKLPDGRAEIVSGFADGDAAKSPGWKASIVRFSGAYAPAFLDAQRRPRMLSLAERLADAGQAQAVAFYGRCAHISARDLGAYFRGSDASTTAAALVYSMGFFAESPAVSRSAISALGGGELDSLKAAATKLDRTTFAQIVGNLGGGITETASGMALTFPLGGPTRATGAARAVARKIGVGVD